MKILEAAENYLEAILVITERKGSCRAIDICNELGYSKPTVSAAVHGFIENGCITVGTDGHISLTESGRSVAEKIYERHRVIAGLLIRLGVDEETAYADACKIEHDVSETTFEHLKRYCEKHR